MNKCGKAHARRKKAFLGALVSTVGGLIGGAISARKQRKAAEAQQREAQIAANTRAGFEQAQNMSAAIANQDYVDAYKQRIKFEGGGKVPFFNTKGLGDAAVEGGGSIAGLLISKPIVTKEVVTGSGFNAGSTKQLTNNSYAGVDTALPTIGSFDRLSRYRLGGRKRRC